MIPPTYQTFPRLPFRVLVWLLTTLLNLRTCVCFGIEYTDELSYPSPSTAMFLGTATAIGFDHGSIFYNPATLGTFPGSSLSGSVSGQSRFVLRLSEEGEGNQRKGQQWRGSGTMSAIGLKVFAPEVLKLLSSNVTPAALENLAIGVGFYTPNDFTIDQEITYGELPQAGLLSSRQQLFLSVQTLRGGVGWSYPVSSSLRIGQSLVLDSFDRRASVSIHDKSFSTVMDSQQRSQRVNTNQLSFGKLHKEVLSLHFIHGIQWLVRPWFLVGFSHQGFVILQNKSRSILDYEGVRTDESGVPLSPQKASELKIDPVYVSDSTRVKGSPSNMPQILRSGFALNLQDFLVVFDLHYQLPYKEAQISTPGVWIPSGALSWYAWQGGALRLAGRVVRSPFLPLSKAKTTNDSFHEYKTLFSVAQRFGQSSYSLGFSGTLLDGEARSFVKNESYDPILKTRGFWSTIFLGISTGVL